MKLTFDHFLALKKTKSEASLVSNDVYISRSAVQVKIDEKLKTIFGFGASFCEKKSETSSIYELLEHLVFLPYVHSEKSLDKPVSYTFTDNIAKQPQSTVREFLIGSMGPKGIFGANGCAISSDEQLAITHSKRELIERHLCCKIWYHRTYPLLPCPEFKIQTYLPSVELELYTIDIDMDGVFVIAALECCEEGFFTLGAAIRSNTKDASNHATCEALMLFNDAKKKRLLGNSIEQSRQNLLSLRERKISQERKIHFQSLVTDNSIKCAYIAPICKTIVFEPLSNIYAARTLSADALDPREFNNRSDTPLLPLF